MDVGALVGGASGLVVGVLAWTQTRATNKRSDFTAITERLDQELKDERTQRKLLTSFVLDLLRWAQRVEPDTQAGPPPEPPAEMDLTPWRR
ncbi:hypothetical protein DV517_62440 [Streptomyces sp. S816]|uniref:hypothetical protein n=1 Tax=Streptomyces sp. S816 TaxID=2283197 RepID=UPI00109C34EC|nr:hypothetical protein [Streptomyces sp. S816]TGZ14761.1 hypothetical protein DV517_62440 [Streptomyces sp. S816]